ncbi:MAG TPA: hypothetical protein EYO59_09155, partial [Chromatiaceae bacterium]|nr:hypothetical protein [Chromatiaceae bacterium]
MHKMKAITNHLLLSCIVCIIATVSQQTAKAQSADIAWTNDLNVDITGATLTRNLSSGDPAGAASTDSLQAGEVGWIAITIGEIASTRGFGFTSTFIANYNYKGFDYGFEIKKNKVAVYDNGKKTKAKSEVFPGDQLAIHRVGSVVYFLQNGAVFWTAATPSSGAMIAQASLLKRAGAQLLNAQQCFGCGAGSPPPSGDNLGNHRATENIRLNSNYISNDGDNEGLTIDDAGKVGR